MSKAMVVDDSRAVRMILRRTLEKHGYQVLEAGHGKEALEVLEQHPDVGLMLVDWNMPEMNGLELIRAVRSNPERSRIVLMMVTTETEIEQMVRALAAGANEYVMKPFTEEVITDKLKLLGVIS
jgi:two-component system chemotaxis response regulator CheY